MKRIHAKGKEGDKLGCVGVSWFEALFLTMLKEELGAG